MSTSNFSAIEDLGNHSDGSIYNPELSDMEVDSPEELPLPKHIAGKPLNRKRMNTNVHQDLTAIPSHTVNVSEELPPVRQMTGRTPNLPVSEDLPPVKHMGNQMGIQDVAQVPDMNPGCSSLHKELPLALPPVRTLKHHAQVSEVFPIGKKLHLVPGPGSIPLPENHPARNPAGIDTQSLSWEGNDIILPIPQKMTKDNRQVLPMPRVWYNALMAAHNELRKSPETRIPYGQAANFHIRANRCRLAEERETNAELKHLKSKLRGLQHMLQTWLNEV